MYLSIAAKWWREILIMVLSIALWVVWSWKDSIAKERDQLNYTIQYNATDYENNVKVVEKEKKVIETKWKTKVVEITKWRDNNATCGDAMDYINNYAY